MSYRKNELEEKMLLNLNKRKWTDHLNLHDFNTFEKNNEETIKVHFFSI